MTGLEHGTFAEKTPTEQEENQGQSFKSCVYGAAKLLIVCAVVLVVLIFTLGRKADSPGGFRSRYGAIMSVKDKTIEIQTPNATRQYTIQDLIRNYDPDKHAIYGIKEEVGGALDWKAEFTNGKYIVSCMNEGRLYSFETDLNDVRPISSAAQELFDLQYSRFK